MIAFPPNIEDGLEAMQNRYGRDARIDAEALVNQSLAFTIANDRERISRLERELEDVRRPSARATMEQTQEAVRR